MQDNSGYFYYQKHKYFTNKISYIRWGQAWMMLALAAPLEILEGKRKDKSIDLERLSNTIRIKNIT